MSRFLILLFLAASASWAGEAVTVQLNWKHQFEFAAFYAAEAKGYYSAAGLEVAVREGGPGIDVVKEVLEGRADFGVGASALVVERARGRPVTALAALMQHSPIALLALHGQGVHSVHDLANRPVAVDPHSRDEIEAFLLSSGLPAASLRFVDQTDWTLASLDSGREAAKVIYVSNELFMIRGREHEFLLLPPRSAGIDLFGNVLFSAEFTTRARPKAVQAFRTATLKGLVYALEHPEEIAALIEARFNSQGKSLAHLLYEAAQIRELTRPDIVEPGYMSPGRWRHVAEVYAGQGKMPRDFDLTGFIYDPRPPILPQWLVWALALALAGLAAALIVAARGRSMNRRLQHEIDERREVESALQISEARYRELVENANAIILRLAPDGTVTYFNRFAEDFFGFRAEEIVGRPVVGAIVPERESKTGRDLAGLLDAILKTPERYSSNENENITKDGRRVYVRWSNRALTDNQGRLTGLLCIGHDITEPRIG